MHLRRGYKERGREQDRMEDRMKEGSSMTKQQVQNNVANGKRMDLPSVILLFFLLFGGSLGLMLNGGLLFTNLAKRNFSHPKYCLFIYCLLFSNFLYTIVEITLQPWLIINRRVSKEQALCKFAGFLFFCGGVSSVFYQTLLSVNRYLLLCREDLNMKVFAKQFTWFYILGVLADSSKVSLMSHHD
uniref:G-protein coupled receptors family 1 profile domain-containing protein n=1 Tax=Romanomermis culicivorax TaxID=13658 RepID=A0A915J9M8_ROMCU